MVEPKHDTVVVFTEEDIETLQAGSKITKQGHTFGYGCRGRGFCKVLNTSIERLRQGHALNWELGPVSVIHEDYAGTPKSQDAIVQSLFEMFQNSEGERRSVALECLHMFGYRVEKNVEYELVQA